MKKGTTALILAFFAAVATAQSPSPLEILSPKAGAIYHVGDTMKVQWIIHGSRIPQSVLPLLSPDAGMTWLQIFAQGIRPSDTAAYHDSVGTVFWKVADTLLYTGGLIAEKVCTISESNQVNFYLPYDSDMGTFITAIFAIRLSASAVKTDDRARRTNNVSILRGRNPLVASNVFQLDGRRFLLHQGVLSELWVSRGTLPGIHFAHIQNGNDNQVQATIVNIQ